MCVRLNPSDRETNRSAVGGNSASGVSSRSVTDMQAEMEVLRRKMKGITRSSSSVSFTVKKHATRALTQHIYIYWSYVGSVINAP